MPTTTTRLTTLNDGVGGTPSTTRVISTTTTGTSITTKAGTAIRFPTSKLESIKLGGLTPISALGLAEAPPQPYSTPQPVPDPEPKKPFEELPGDPRLIPGTKELDQNPERYTEGQTAWRIQAEPQITPLELPKGTRPELKPVLWADGVIVKIGDEYLCSKRTLADILNSKNPHYDIAVNGRVLNRPMGKSVPIISIDVSKLKEMGDQRDRINRYAGVKSVDYVNESSPVPGTNIPQGLLNQINWTLVDQLERYPDRFEVYDILASLKGDYSVTIIEGINRSTEQSEVKLGRDVQQKLSEFMNGIGKRLELLRKDFNNIKATFYNGDPPPGTVPTLKYYRIAKTVDPEEEGRKNSTVFKSTTTVRVEESPTAGVIRELADLKNIKTGGLATTIGGLTGAGAQRNALIAKWQSYKWTADEANYLKGVAVKMVENPPRRPYVVYTASNGAKILRWDGYEINSAIVGITDIRWTPVMVSKAAISVPLPDSWEAPYVGAVSLLPNARIYASRVPELIRLFGEPDTAYKSLTTNRRESWWLESNAKRQAEIIRLAYDIRKIEMETGKTIPPVQPAGVTLGATGVNTGPTGVNTTGRISTTL